MTRNAVKPAQWETKLTEQQLYESWIRDLGIEAPPMPPPDAESIRAFINIAVATSDPKQSGEIAHLANLVKQWKRGIKLAKDTMERINARSTSAVVRHPASR